MNMEELTKSQIVLLTLFVSFVTSIATGIVTVSLVQQAPPAITQSVSRVIQETVQTVAPKTAGQAAAAAVTEEKTVVVNDSDLVAKAVATVEPSLVRVYLGDGDSATFAGMGVVLDQSGTIAADYASIGESHQVEVSLSDGSSVEATVVKRDQGTGIAYLAATSTNPITWTPISISTGHVVLGQSLVALSGKTASRIGSGLATALVASGDASTSPQIIETNIAQDSIMPGSPLIDENGALVGLSTSLSRTDDASSFLSASVLAP